MRRLIALSILALVGCGESHSACGTSTDAPTCFRGSSGSAGCCLESDAVRPLCNRDSWICPSGYFTEAECGAVSPVCEAFDAGPADGGDPCAGPQPICYQGWSSSPGCCLEDSTMGAMCSAEGWTCPASYFLFAECFRLSPICEGADAGPAPGLYDDCERTSDCQIVANTCCGVCGMASAEDMTAIARAQSTEYYGNVACPESRDGDVLCPDCPTILNPHLVATCDMTGFRPACAQVDLAADPFSTCEIDSDCFLTTPSCCACGDISIARTIAVNSTSGSDVNALTCDSDAPCPPCVPTFDPRARAACVGGACTVATD